MKQSSIERIQNDPTLKPLFIDYIGENLKKSMAEFYRLETPGRIKFKSSASRSLVTLIKEVESRIEGEDVYEVIESVCKHYMVFMSVAGGGIFNFNK
jgi:hypothetical protein